MSAYIVRFERGEKAEYRGPDVEGYGNGRNFRGMEDTTTSTIKKGTIVTVVNAKVAPVCDPGHPIGRWRAVVDFTNEEGITDRAMVLPKFLKKIKEVPSE